MCALLSLPVLRIGNRYYRQNPLRSSDLACSLPLSYLEGVDSELRDLTVNEMEQGSFLPFIEGIHLKDNRFTCTLRIPCMFHRFIHGPQKSTLIELEKNHACRLNLPKPGSNSPSVRIVADSHANVEAVCRKITWIVSQSRTKIRPTHFISLPITEPMVQEAFRKFSDDVISRTNRKEMGFEGLCPYLLQLPEKLHFTIVMLVLADDHEVQLAKDLMADFCQNKANWPLFSGGPLRLSIKGLDYMNDDPSATDVLYAQLRPTYDHERFQKMADRLYTFFSDNGLVSDNFVKTPVKLHLTVLNSKFPLQNIESTESRDSASLINSRPKFNASGLLREYADFSFSDGQILSDCFHLSVRGSYSRKTGFYSCLAKIRLSFDDNKPMELDCTCAD